MTTEIEMLMFSILLGIAMLLAAAGGATIQRGLKWNLGARDKHPPELTGIAGRLERAFRNFLETFGFFAAAVLVCLVLNISNSATSIGTQLYFYSRVIYIPLYVAGIPLLRTMVWTCSLIGICLVIYASMSSAL